MFFHRNTILHANRPEANIVLSRSISRGLYLLQSTPTSTSQFPTYTYHHNIHYHMSTQIRHIDNNLLTTYHRQDVNVHSPLTNFTNKNTHTTTNKTGYTIHRRKWSYFKKMKKYQLSYTLQTQHSPASFWKQANQKAKCVKYIS